MIHRVRSAREATTCTYSDHESYAEIRLPEVVILDTRYSVEHSEQVLSYTLIDTGGSAKFFSRKQHSLSHIENTSSPGTSRSQYIIWSAL